MKLKAIVDLSNNNFVSLVKEHRKELIGVLLTQVIIFIIYKMYYPSPSFIYDDSINYINTALEKSSINIYLVGYGYFLRLFSMLSNSVFVLIIFQFFALSISQLILLLIIFTNVECRRSIRNLTLVLFSLNPVLLYVSNLISSDCLFLILSFVWLSTLILLIRKWSWMIVIFHSIVLVILFTVRYNAICCLLISIVVLPLMIKSLLRRIVVIGIPLFFILLFIFYTSLKYQKLTGILQFSPFSGWQLANNAMYSFRYIQKSERIVPPKDINELDYHIRQYFDTTKNLLRNPTEMIKASTFYMWKRDLPLWKYRDALFREDTISSDYKKWATMGPLYRKYGLFVIKQYPQAFLKHFVMPNAIRYFAPPTEYLEKYNNGYARIPQIAIRWFQIKDPKIILRTKETKYYFTNLVPIFSGMVHGLYLVTLIFYFVNFKVGYKRPLDMFLLITTSYIIIHAIFIIFTAPTALRFQMFELFLCFIDSMLIVSRYVRVPLISNSYGMTNAVILNS